MVKSGMQTTGRKNKVLKGRGEDEYKEDTTKYKADEEKKQRGCKEDTKRMR